MLRAYPFAIVASLLAFSLSAEAQTRVAVLGFSGPRGGQARAAVVRALSAEHEVVSLSEWRDAAERIGASGHSSGAYASIAAEVGAKAVVTGGVSRARRRRWALGVAVRHGANGTIVGRAGRAMRNLGGAGSAGQGVARRVVELVAEARGPGEGGGGEVDPGEGGGGDASEMVWGPEDGGEDSGDVQAAGGGGSGQQEGSGSGGGVSQSLDPELSAGGGAQAIDTEGHDPPPSTPSSEGSASGWLDVGLEISVGSRTFTVPINPLVDTQARPGARVQSGFFPEIGLRLAFYPLVLFLDGWPTGFGLNASFHHHMSLQINRTVTEGEPPLSIEAGAYSLAFGLSYRAILGSETVGATIGGGLGYGRHSFFLGADNNDLVPPFVYDHIYLELSAYVPFATRHVGLDLAVAYLGVVTIGAAAARAYNESGALPSSNGFSLFAGLSGQIWRGLRWRIAFELVGYVTGHTGVGQGWGTAPSTVVGTGGGQGIETVGPSKDYFFRLVPQLVYRFGGGQGGGPAAGSTDVEEDEAEEDAITGEWIEGPAAEDSDGGEDAGADPPGGGDEPDDDGWLTTD